MSFDFMFSLSLFVTLICIDFSRHFRTCQFKSLGGPAISEEYLKSKRAGWEKRREESRWLLKCPGQLGMISIKKRMQACGGQIILQHPP